MVEADSGGTFLRNGKFLRMMSEQGSPPDSPETAGLSEEDDEAVHGNRTPSIFRKADNTSETQETSSKKTDSNVGTQGISEPRPESEVQAELPKVLPKRQNSNRRVQFSDQVGTNRTRHPREEYVQDPSHPPFPCSPSGRSG